MGNTWEYSLQFSSSRELGETEVRLALNTLREEGIELPGSGEGLIFTEDGLDSPTGDPEGTISQLVVTGGHLTLWNRTDPRDPKDVYLSIWPKRGKISVGALHELVHEGDADKEALLLRVVRRLCAQLEPVIGLSCDEHLLEMVLIDILGRTHRRNFEQHQDWLFATANALEIPRILYWFTYLEERLFKRVKPMLHRMRHRSEACGVGGFCIFLAEHAWEARMAKLGPGGQYLPTWPDAPEKEP